VVFSRFEAAGKEWATTGNNMEAKGGYQRSMAVNWK
jgi:hypothetical protein